MKLLATLIASDARFGNHFTDRLEVHLLEALHCSTLT